MSEGTLCVTDSRQQSKMQVRLQAHNEPYPVKSHATSTKDATLLCYLLYKSEFFIHPQCSYLLLPKSFLVQFRCEFQDFHLNTQSTEKTEELCIIHPRNIAQQYRHKGNYEQ